VCVCGYHIMTTWDNVLFVKLIVCSASQEILYLLLNPEVYYCVHKSPLCICHENKIVWNCSSGHIYLGVGG
jgi:hypothetical protein